MPALRSLGQTRVPGLTPATPLFLPCGVWPRPTPPAKIHRRPVPRHNKHGRKQLASTRPLPLGNSRQIAQFEENSTESNTVRLNWIQTELFNVGPINSGIAAKNPATQEFLGPEGGRGESNLPYPPNVNPNDRRAPWNQPPAPECPDCDQVIHDCGDHDPNCTLAGMDSVELHRELVEQAESDKADIQFEQQRIDSHLNRK